MVEMFTPEMMAIAIAALVVLNLLTFLTVLIKIVSLSRMMGNTVANLAEAIDRVESIERRLDGFGDEIAGNQNRLEGHGSKLNEHDTLLAQAGQMMGKEAAGFNQAIQRIHTLEDDIQGLKAFQRTFEQTRNRILDALGAMSVEIPPPNAQTTEQKDSKEETVIPSEEKILDTEDFHKSRMRHP